MKLTLCELAVGEQARVVGYAAGGEYAEMLMRLGLLPGTTLTHVRRAPLNDPIEIRLRGFSLAIRPSEACDLLLERI